MTAETRSDSLTSVHLITLGCARNEVDSSELAARLEVGGFQLVDDPEAADAVMVNTCGFIEAAKKDSVDTLLAAADLKTDGKAQAVVAVGCMAERYGKELADSLPEADAVLGFDDYASVAERLQSILAGNQHQAHVPRDRRTLLPISPVDRQAAAGGAAIPGHAPVAPDLPTGLAPASGPRVVRRRLDGAPSAPLKLASGCDRRCTFCAIPSFRGAYVSRTPDEIVAEARWLAENGVREAFLVSENSSSYGKDLGDIRLLERLLGDLAAVDGLDWVRVSYLQPAETRPTLVQTMATTPGVVPYFDLSFQHASAPVLRRMRRFGHTETFLGLIESIRALAPRAGIRSNVIVGFPGETEDDVQVLSDFLIAAGLDAIGVFGYSDEEGTEAVGFDGKLSEDEIEDRRNRLTDLADELVAARAEERIGEPVRVLIEEVADGEVIGRAEHQGPEVDGATTVTGLTDARPGMIVSATVIGTDGVDLIADAGEPA
ncbi:30S ribosomal protein S12 methylthiotransferase RimO [Microlunatus parietis]|uniref:Ribosomal protein uS12 methylthiotransferase RimO n=1 Tax=Microlunatus parietis TaxID=682979 RepID=A0A7Y9I363_9ACTN|nr:30S ribosomal protein S12 methylthiotransferase RimO [Microlunatus parietis]NYE69371.1 ribosomal protein S12 methylthiotransferase RimO [Microlunatus parietis]